MERDKDQSSLVQGEKQGGIKESARPETGARGGVQTYSKIPCFREFLREF
jgi:hypothetical protein